MLMKIPLLHQSLVLLLSISPLERDLIKLPNCLLPPEISAIQVGLVAVTPAPGKSCAFLGQLVQAGQSTVGCLKWQLMPAFRQLSQALCP